MGTLAPDRELVSAPAGELSSLGVARAKRRLTVDEVAKRAGLSREAVEALEQSRLYRFPSMNEAVAAAVLYTSALGISQNEARHLGGSSGSASETGWRGTVSHERERPGRWWALCVLCKPGRNGHDKAADRMRAGRGWRRLGGLV